MNCPVCKNTLAKVESFGVHLDICELGCGGVWFDALELEKFDSLGEEIDDRILRPLPQASVTIDRSAERFCPHCNTEKMERRLVGDHHEIEIDQCPRCAGVWVDMGELNALRLAQTSAEERESTLANIRQAFGKAGAPRGLEAVLRLVFKG